MKVIFDHNIPAKLRRHLPGYDVYTAGWLNWNHLSNGELIAASEEAAFDLILTGDQNMIYQQNNRTRRIAVVVLSRTDWPSPLENLELILRALERARRNSYEFVKLPDWAK